MDVQPNHLLESLGTLYEFIDGRPCSSLQPHEVLIFLADVDFIGVFNTIREEIQQLESQTRQDYVALEHVDLIVKWCESRGYVFGSNFDASEEPSRANLLFECTGDLLAARLIHKKALQHSLISSSSKTAASINNLLDSVQTINKALQIQPENPSIESLPQSLRQINSKCALPAALHHLLIRSLPDTSKISLVSKLVESLNTEYETRRTVLSKRLDITIASFLKSPKCQEEDNQKLLPSIIQKSILQRREWEGKRIYIWDILSATRDLLQNEKVSVSEGAMKGVFSNVTIGAVPDRGGLPEGYTHQQVERDVMKANLQLQQKDQQKDKQDNRASNATDHPPGSKRVDGPPVQRGRKYGAHNDHYGGAHGSNAGNGNSNRGHEDIGSSNDHRNRGGYSNNNNRGGYDNSSRGGYGNSYRGGYGSSGGGYGNINRGGNSNSNRGGHDNSNRGGHGSSGDGYGGSGGGNDISDRGGYNSYSTGRGGGASYEGNSREARGAPRGRRGGFGGRSEDHPPSASWVRKQC